MTPARGRIILDLDSSESPVYGQQEGSSYNGHFGLVGYHLLFCFNQYGDCEAAMLRPGHVHSAEHWQQLLAPVVARYPDSGRWKYLPVDAAFAKLKVYQYLEQQGFRYVIRLPAVAAVLQASLLRVSGNIRCYRIMFKYYRRFYQPGLLTSSPPWYNV